jgi:hypothetical protein
MLTKKTRRGGLLLAGLLLAAQAPAHALFGDEAILAMQLAEEKAFHAFMQVQVVQQVLTLKQNYDASVRYFNDFKQLNSGQGIFQNIAAEVKSAQTQENHAIQQQLNSDFGKNATDTSGSSTAVDKFYKSLDQGIANNIKYAGDEFANLIANRQSGQNIAASAAGLAPKDAANLSAKAQGIQVQMLTQIHEDNLRLIQLQSMQLATEARRQQGDSSSLQNIQKSLQTRFPTAGIQSPDDGGNQ